MKIETDKSLKDLTTFQINTKARFYCLVKNQADLEEALKFASQKKLPYFVLAGGSNLIIADTGFPGLVIKINFTSWRVDGTKLAAGAGVMVEELVVETSEEGLAGLEWAGGLPGTIGGAVRGNAGAFGGEMKDIVTEVRSMKLEAGRMRETLRNNKQCQFDYRTSIFKRNKEIILEVKFQLRRGDPAVIQKMAQDHRQYRQQKHPMGLPSAGSTFKNILLKNVNPEIAKLFSDSVKTDPIPVIPAAKVLAEAGLIGYTIGGAQVSLVHPNYIVNLSNAKASDIIAIINHEVKTVKEKFGLALEVEPQLIGFERKFPWESH